MWHSLSLTACAAHHVQVMSDVRPWGKRAADSLVVAGTGGGGSGVGSPSSRGSVFIKRGPPVPGLNGSPRTKIK